MKILHFADAHANKNFEQYSKSLDIIKQYASQVDFIVFAGDLFDSRIYAQYEYNRIIDSFSSLADIKPVFMVYGTPSHDAPGSLEILKSIHKKYPIVIVDKINKEDFWGFKDNTFLYKEHGDIDIIAFPWIMQSRLLSDEEMITLGVMERKELEQSRLEEWIEHKRNFYTNSNVPITLVAHAQLIDSVYSVGQDISPTFQDPNWFYNICTVGMFGHIHKQHNNRNLYYSGSIYNKNWGEMEEKGFYIHDIRDMVMNSKSINLNTSKRIRVECDTYEDYVEFKNRNEDYSDYEMWLIIYVSNKNQINEELEQNYWNNKVISLRLDIKLINIETMKREKVEMEGLTLVDKFVKWCEINSLEYNYFQIEKIKELT